MPAASPTCRSATTATVAEPVFWDTQVRGTSAVMPAPCRRCSPRKPLRGEARSRRRRGGCRRTVACVDRPTEDIDGCQAAHSRLAAAINDLPDAVVRQPSLLPDWTVGHVLTHLARNAEAMVRRIEAATRGELIDQYPGGARGRAAEIEAGADRPAHELITDVRNWAQRLDAVFGSLPDDLWNHQVRSLQGSEHPIAQLPFHRWWEVEVHLVDLGIGLTPDDWTQQLVDRALPWLIAGLRDRADDRSLMAWMLGRSSPPNLDPWR